MKEIDFKVSLENPEHDAKKLYQKIRPDVEIDDIEYSEFSDGVLNLVVKLDDKKYREPLVIRSYLLKILKLRNQTEKDRCFHPDEIKRRIIELASIKKINHLNITVNLVATYKNGFVYKYVDADLNSASLYDQELAKKVAAKMARLHSTSLKELENERAAMFYLVERIDKEREAMIDQQMKDSSSEEMKKVPLFSEIKKEFRRLHALILKGDAYGKVCLCHNDLNMSNLLVEKKTREPIIIDFEWASLNFSMFDISYHLFTLAGLFCQYFNVEDIPNDESIKKWLVYYNEEANRLSGVEMPTNEFNEMIENDLKKVLVNMLLIRLVLVERSFYFMFPNNKTDVDVLLNYTLPIYEDYLNNKDKHLKLLETLKK